MQNPFENPGFSMASLTAAINLLPNRYGRLEQLNLFPAKPTRFRQIIIEERNGVLNLLPIPILDGGHLLYYVLEIIKRGPLSERSMEIGQHIGLALMLTLMACAFYNDINRLISG